jgi:HEAT repeat protein
LRLSSVDAPEVRSLLVTAHHQGFLGFDDLPKQVQRQVRAGETTERFIGQSDAYLKDFESCQDPKTYLKYLNVLVTVLPELVSRGESRIVSAIFDVMLRHLSDDVPPFLGRNRFIMETLQHFESGGFLDGLIRMTTALPKEQREILERAVSLFGAPVVPGLVNQLAATEDTSARRAICSMLVRIGEPGVGYMVDELRSHRHAWFAARNIISVLAEIGSETTLPVIHQYCGHPHAKVREECAQALSRLLGSDSEVRLLEFLNDREEAVVRRAVQGLAGIHSTHRRFLDRVAEAIRLRTRDEDEPSDALQATCLRALQEYERIILPPEPNFDQILLEIVNPPRLKTLLPGRFGVRTKPDVLRVLAIDTLGTRGSRSLQGPLAVMAESKSDEIADAARRAIARIHRRLSGS